MAKRNETKNGPAPATDASVLFTPAPATAEQVERAEVVATLTLPARAEDAKRGPVIACETFPAGDATLANGKLAFTFQDGDKFTVQLCELSRAILEQCALHGLKQKLVDAAAISRNPDTGRSATVADKKAAVIEVRDRILSGTWNKVREGGGGAVAGGLFFRAVCRLYPNRTAEFLREFLGKKTEEELKAMRASARVAEMVATIKAEEAAAAPAPAVDPFAGLDD